MEAAILVMLILGSEALNARRSHFVKVASI